MNDAIALLILSTIIGLISTAFWRWVSSISDISRDNASKMDALRGEFMQFQLEFAGDYQRKSDAHIDNERIIKAIDELKGDVKELSHKLDRKMDK